MSDLAITIKNLSSDIIHLLQRLFSKSVMYCAYTLAKLFGAVRAPWTKKKITFNDVKGVLDLIEPGDVILTRTYGELTDVIIPGHWKHSAIYVGDMHIIEARGIGVNKANIFDLLMRADEAVVLRASQMDEKDRRLVATCAEKYIGFGYDYWIDITKKKKMYCSELVYHSYSDVYPNYVTLRYTFGFKSLSPDDIFYNDKFYSVWKKATGKVAG